MVDATAPQTRSHLVCWPHPQGPMQVFDTHPESGRIGYRLLRTPRGHWGQWLRVADKLHDLKTPPGSGESATYPDGLPATTPTDPAPLVLLCDESKYG